MSTYVTFFSIYLFILVSGQFTIEFVGSESLEQPLLKVGIQTDSRIFNISAAYQSIIDRYDSDYGLVSENEYNKKYWLWSDNLLAAQVVKEYNYGVYKNITSTVKHYIENYGLKPHTAWAALIDDDIVADFVPSFNASESINLVDDIWYSDYGGNHELRCIDYANIAFLKSIYLYKLNKVEEGKKCFLAAMSTFDGVGFKDKSFIADGSRYSTYKVALWKIASNVTGFGPSYQANDIIARMQSDEGAVHTFYSMQLVPSGQTNVETTAIAIMALKIH